MRELRCGRAPGVLATLLTTSIAGAGGLAPFTEEAVQRSLDYLMQSYPQPQGHQGFGCGFADLDADGDEDVVLLGRVSGAVGLFENDGTGHFTDRTAGSGIPLLDEAGGLVAFDYDADGDLDLYLTQVGAPNVLVRNDGGFTFTDVSAVAGVDDDGAGESAAAGDYDGDGRLDLYVCNYNGIVPGTADKDNRLYRNLGDGTFEDVSVEQTVDDPGYGFQSVWTDYDRDGDVDLYLSNDRGHLAPLYRTNQLWRNDGGQLVNVSVGSGADLGLFSMGVAAGDFDDNGWPDLYCTNIGGYDDGFNPLFLNQGDGTFVEASAPAGVDQYVTSWGSIFFDLDNDGTQDLYVNNMFVPNMLHLNLGTFPCVEIAAEAGVQASPEPSFGSAVADVDGDGDLDLLVNNLGGNVELFMNQEGQQRRWLRLRIAGQGDNAWAVGANADVRFGAVRHLQEILAGGNGYKGQNGLVLHFGADQAFRADEVAVTWPGGQTVRLLTNLPTNQVWTVHPPERLGDADGDGDVLLDDFVAFAACYEAPFAPGCELMDLDGDSEVDLADYGLFVDRYEGELTDCDGNQRVDLLDILGDPARDADQDGVLDVCAAVVPGDLSGDGLVDIADVLVVLSAWGPCPGAPAPCPADATGDGVVDVSELLLVLANWGATA